MLGVELRETAVAALAIADDGRVLAREEQPPAGDPVAAALKAIESVAPAGGGSSPLIGVAADTPDLTIYSPVLDAVGARYAGAPPTTVVPSGTAAAAAEAWIGAAAGASDVVYFAAGDRMLAGIVVRGEPMRGAHGRAGAAAWLALNPVEREDYRKHGCLEAEAASSGIVRRLIWRIKAGDRSRVQDAVDGDLSAISVAMVLDAARQGDGVSISVMRDTAKYLGMAAANLVAATDPDVLVLGGILASAADLLFEPVRTELARRLAPPTHAVLRIVPAALGSDAAAIGAARLVAAAAR